MTSKATAALLRLREMDKKYKSKQEDKYLMSSESSKSIVDDEKHQQTFRHQLSIKMPDPYEEYVDSNSCSDSKKHSLPVKVVSESSKVVSTRSLNSEDSYQKDEQVVKDERISEQIVINDNDKLEKDESNESISEILEDSQSISEITAKSLIESNGENSSLNIPIESIASVSNQKTEIEEEKSEEEKEEIEEENSDLKESFPSVKYSDESFESSSSDVDNSQSKTKTSSQLESKINIEENLKVNTKTFTTIFKNKIQFDGSNYNFVKDGKINTDSFSLNDGNKAIEEVISDNSKTRHSKLQESEETSNSTLESSNSSSTHRSTASKKRSFSKNEDKTEKQLLYSQTIVENNVDENKEFTEKHLSKLKNAEKYMSKLKIEKSSSRSETLVTSSKKSVTKISTRSSDTKQSSNSTTITSSSSTSSSSLSSSSSSSSSSKLSQIIRHEDSEKLHVQRKRKHTHVKQKQKYISSAMINYLERLKEEQQRLLMWPAHLICPEKIEMKIVRPLELSQNFYLIQCNAEMNKNLDPNFEILRNRLLDIRQWLKEQYLLYKENSELAANINKNYCPTTLEETKKIINQLQRKPRTKNKNQ